MDNLTQQASTWELHYYGRPGFIWETCRMSSSRNDGSINATGNPGGTDVFCSGQFSATPNAGATGGVTNGVEPVPDLLENK